jgi:hypothetical protein
LLCGIAIYFIFLQKEQENQPSYFKISLADLIDLLHWYHYCLKLSGKHFLHYIETWI